ncbi:MAG: DUF4336 domain-containing protein [Rhodobacterales bacterium]|nr:MAG: DUF4336 domain-containing protein [Rhodobacterales bacterium]
MHGYSPLNTLKPVAEDIWLVDGPAIRFYGVPFTTRMTVIRLENGDIWLHSPTQIDPALKAQIDALGPVRHLIAPNWIHYAYINQWRTAYPEARSHVAPGVKQRAHKMGVALTIDAELSQQAPEAWQGQIAQMLVEGSSYHREVVFFHIRSKTLILTDLCENIPKHLLPWWVRPLAWLGGVLAPHGGTPRDMRLTFRKGHQELRTAVLQMIDWAPERIIIAHGNWMKTDGVAHLKRIFRWVL